MKIRKLRLQNFRGFEDKTFEFSDQFNVLIGDNGTGKTSILDALAFVVKITLHGFPVGGPPIGPDDVRQVRYEKGKTLTLEPQSPVILSSDGVLADKEFSWEIVRGKGDTGRHELEIIVAQLKDQVQNGEDVLLPRRLAAGSQFLFGHGKRLASVSAAPKRPALSQPGLLAQSAGPCWRASAFKNHPGQESRSEL